MEINYLVLIVAETLELPPCCLKIKLLIYKINEKMKSG